MTILMARPTYFDVHYRINPWMSKKEPVHRDHASAQWESLAAAIQTCANIEEIPTAAHPDFVFTANAGLVRNNEVILSSFRYHERKGEEPHWESWFRNNQYTVHTLTNTTFEGAGDALFTDSHTLIGGYGFRSDKQAYDQIEHIWDISILRVELIDPRFYHLDTCLCVLNESTILWYPDAFSKESQYLLQDQYTCIEVSEAEALHFVCNAVVIGEHVILPSGAPNVITTLKTAGYIPTTVHMTEFIKSGGAAKCLTLVL
jgi:N-dimethylarginine dimethylaminohydrolase